MRRGFLLACTLLWACAGTADLRGDEIVELVTPVLSEEEIVHHLERGAQLMQSGLFAESAGHFERVLTQESLSRPRQVLALAGAFTAWHLQGDQQQERRAARRFFRFEHAAVGTDQELLSNAASSELRRLRQVALRVVAAADAEVRRGVAAGPRNPIPVLAPSEAGETLGWIGCGRQGGGRYMIESDEERQVRGVEYKVLAGRCSLGGQRRVFWFDLSLWYAFTASHLEGIDPPMGFTREDAARVVSDEFGRSSP